MNFKDFRGHCLTNAPQLHVCGYEGDSILFQEKAGDKMKKSKLHQTAKGTYFNLTGKRIYVSVKAEINGQNYILQ